MRFLILIFVLFLGCEDDPVSPETDCDGVVGGTAFIDDCGLCVGGDSGLEENYLMDECGITTQTQPTIINECCSTNNTITISFRGYRVIFTT
jgi:hypothetical protein